MIRQAVSLLVVILLIIPNSLSAGPLRDRLQERQRPESAETSGTIQKPGDYRLTLQHDGLTRRYRVYVPAGYDGTRAVPLLVALHGGGGDMDYMANDAYYGLPSTADREGCVVVFPSGYSRFRGGKLATWNAGNCCGGARDENVDDVGFIRCLVEDLTGRLNIDRRRIYATGMSNGGMMAYRLACELPELFAAIAPVAGTDNTRICAPGQPVSVLHIHARNDDHVLFNGGIGPSAVSAQKVTEFTSVPATVAKWVQIDGCGTSPRRVLTREGAVCELYGPCRDGAEVQLCVTDTGGHSWPGGHKPRGDEPPSQALSANAVMWEFFRRQ